MSTARGSSSPRTMRARHRSGAMAASLVLALAAAAAPVRAEPPPPTTDAPTTPAPTDAAAVLFRGTKVPTVPPVFGALRLGMAARKATAVEPRLVAPPGSGDPIYLPIDGVAGAQVRRGHVGARVLELAIRFDASVESTLEALWGPALHDDAASIWFDPSSRLRARLEAGVLTFARYLPTFELFAPRSPFLGRSLASLRALHGAVERDDQSYGLGYHLPDGPALEWATTSSSIVLLRAGKVVTGFYVNARIGSYPWHEAILAAARARYAERASTRGRSGGAETETFVFEGAHAHVEITLMRRGDQVTMVEIRGRVR